MGLGSLVGAVCVAVRDIAKNQMPEHTMVVIGPPPGDIPNLYVAIGYAGEDRPSVTGRGRDVYGNPGEQTGEEFVVWCTISTGTGDTGDLTGMQQLVSVNATYDLVADALRRNRFLNGVLTAPAYSAIGNYEWTVEDGGSIATVFFQVQVTVPWLM